MFTFKRFFSLFLICTIILAVLSPLSCISFAGTNSKQYISDTIPKVYSSYIKKVKASHPNWKFEFFYTNIDWYEMISKEAEPGRSLISYIYPQSYRSISEDSYDYVSDSYKSYDAGGWYMAADETIAYYMDPRNFFSDESIFQFEKLSYDADIHTLEGVKAILKGSFMDGVKIKNTNNKNILYAQAFMDAAEHSGVSPYHLAARSIQEVGKNGSGSTNGTNSSYPGIYNFYNIGAYAGNSPITNGLKWASSATAGTYGRPWNSQYKSIVGGADYIGEGYINNCQNTIYLEKFDVVSEMNNTSLYTHQYMGNISAAYTEGRSVYNTYKSLEVINNAFTFLIPVYNNMPGAACQAPISADSPRCWLSELKTDNYQISPENALQVATNTFLITVPEKIKKITVYATPYHVSATVSGLNKSDTQETLSGCVTNISTSLKVRISAGVDGDTNRLKYNGNFVNLKNNTQITKLAEKTVSGTKWYQISFQYENTTLKGWVSSDYIYMYPSSVRYYDSIKLGYGENVVNIKVTAQSGSSRDYKLVITRESPETTTEPTTTTQVGTTTQPEIATSTTTPTSSTQEIIINTKYSVDAKNSFIYAIEQNTDLKSFVKNISIKNSETVKFYDGKNEITKGNVYTGLKITILNTSNSKTYSLSVSGDVNGDKEISIFDIIKTRNHILGTAKLTGVYNLAADINGDKEINIFDLIKIRNLILN